MQARKGDFDAALVAYGKDIDISGRVAALDPSNSRWQHLLGVAHSKVAAAQAKKGDVASAASHLKQASGILDPLVRLHPLDTEFSRSLGLLHAQIGDLHALPGELRDALAAYERYAEIFRGLSERDPRNVEWQEMSADGAGKIASLRSRISAASVRREVTGSSDS